MPVRPSVPGPRPGTDLLAPALLLTTHARVAVRGPAEAPAGPPDETRRLTLDLSVSTSPIGRRWEGAEEGRPLEGSVCLLRHDARGAAAVVFRSSSGGPQAGMLDTPSG